MGVDLYTSLTCTRVNTVSVKIYSVVYTDFTKTTLFFTNNHTAHFFLQHNDWIYNW